MRRFLALVAAAALLAASRPAEAFWSELLSDHSSSNTSSNHHALDDNSGAGAGMCVLAGTVLGVPANLAFGIYDAAIGLLGRRPSVKAGIAELIFTIPQLVFCAVGIGMLESPIAPRTVGENGLFIGVNILLLVTPLVLAIHGVWAIARDKSHDPPRAALVPTVVSDGLHAGPGVALGGAF